MKKKVNNPRLIKPWLIMGIVGVVVLLGILIKISGWADKDTFCGTWHPAKTELPKSLKTANDWLTLGDVDYELGNCSRAITDLQKAVALNPSYAEAYNNMAYVQMRLRQYDSALANLNIALELRPDYPHALINRGDIYNFYYSIDKTKAIADYDRVIAMGKSAVVGESVCGHRLMAINKGNWFKTMWDVIMKKDDSGCLQMQAEK